MRGVCEGLIAIGFFAEWLWRYAVGSDKQTIDLLRLFLVELGSSSGKKRVFRLRLVQVAVAVRC
jgi:hypothetical protein